MSQDREVDDVDDADDVAVEALLAAELSRILLSADPSSAAPVAITPDAWSAIVDAAVGYAVGAWLMRSVTRFLNGAGLPPEEVARVADSIVPGAKRQAVTRVAEAARKTYESTAGAPAKTGLDAEARSDVYRRIRVGSARLARSQLTAAREELRSKMAVGVGAVGKTWRTRKDDRVRLTHGALEGETVGLDERFTTEEGFDLSFPGDPTAPLSETANCRCRLSYLVPASVRAYQPGDSIVQLTSPEAVHDIRSERLPAA